MTDWSAPESDVLATIRDVLESGDRAVLATIVDVEGSAYRRPGAKMIVREEGGGIGHITAGCLEDEVERLSTEILETGEARIETYDLRPEAEDDVWGLGVGCNGIIDVLLEPLDESYREAIDRYDAGKDVGVLTVLDGDDEAIGARAFYDPVTDSFDPDQAFPTGILDRLGEVTAELTEAGNADTYDVDNFSVFVDGIAAPDDLVVVGSGPDAGPIAELGSNVGFRVTVAGFRGASATEERFPDADEVVATSPARLRDSVDFDADTYVVVATHNYVDDRIAIDELLQTDAPYVGLMGPRERFEEMLEDFEAEGRTFSEAELEALYTPVGLDLGSGSPYGIATSIVSEVLAVSNGRDPKHLKDREGRIHDRVELAPED
ncbi:MAG: XdhC family protein [Salinirussus sp.]